MATFFLSLIIAIVGTITNTLSLSYFFMKVGFDKLMRAPDPTTRLFAALNMFDLLLSVSALFYFTSLQTYDAAPAFLTICFSFFTLFLFATSFLTCLLAVVRAIYLAFPFYVVNWKLVNVFMIVYVVVVIVLLLLRVLIPLDHTTLIKIVYHVRFYLVAILFLGVLLSNALAMIKLFLVRSQRDSNSKEKRRATITVGIISIIYCFCNIGFVIITGFPVFSLRSYENISLQIMDILIYIAIPLNSACNPVVYLCRNSEMRSHLKTVWQRLRGACFRISEKKNPEEMKFVKIFIVNTFQ